MANILIKPDNLTVTDFRTGLTWELEGECGLNWREACQRAKSFNECKVETNNDWRLPTLEELKTLRMTLEAARKQSGARVSRDLNSGDYVWSCEECSSNQFSAYALNYIANIPEQKGKDSNYAFWTFCVRGIFKDGSDYAPVKKEEENTDTPSFSTVGELRSWLERGKQ